MSCTYFKTLLYFIVIGLSSASSVRFSRETVPRVKSWHGIDGLGLESWLCCLHQLWRATASRMSSVPSSNQVYYQKEDMLDGSNDDLCAPGVLGLFVNKPYTWAPRKATMTVAPVINQCHWAIRNFGTTARMNGATWLRGWCKSLQIYLTSPDGQPWGSAVNTIGAGGTWLQRPTRRCQTKLLPIQWACPKVNGHRLSLKLLPSLRVSLRRWSLRSSIGWKKRLLCLQLWTEVMWKLRISIQIWAWTSQSTTSAELSFPLPPGCLNKALSSNRAASVTWFGSPMLQPSWTVISGLVNAGTRGGISGGFDTGPSSTLDKGENLGTMDFFLLPHSWLLDSRSHGHRTGRGDCDLWSRQLEGPWGQGGFQLSESPWALRGPVNLRWETSPVGKRSLRRHGSTDSLSFMQEPMRPENLELWQHLVFDTGVPSR